MTTFESDSIHVIIGDSAAGIFRQAFPLQNQMLTLGDVLTFGPTPAFRQLAEWNETRSNYWNAMDCYETPRKLGVSPFDLTHNVSRLVTAPHVYLWAARSGDDQMFIAFVVHLMELHGADPTRIRVIQFDGAEGSSIPVIRGMGYLNVERMRSHPAPVRLDDVGLNAYREAWSALTHETPLLLQDFGQRHPEAPAYLREAIAYLLRRFPSPESGLNFWDWKILSCAARKAPKAMRIVAEAITSGPEDDDLAGDDYVFWRLRCLGNPDLPCPLFALTGDGRSMRGTEVAVTDFGTQMLERRAAWHTFNPIDDWAGGVHLSSANGNLWFNDKGRIVRG
jgi:hypothetical protein